MTRPKSDEKARFNAKVVPSVTGCHEWSSVLHKGGYGKFYFDGKQEFAHRVAHLLFVGEIPKDKWVLHKCDNRRCVNPAHLYLGTPKENTRDKVDRCAWFGNMKYTAMQIDECKKMYADGKTQQMIAASLGIAQQTVSRFVRGKHLKRK